MEHLTEQLIVLSNILVFAATLALVEATARSRSAETHRHDEQTETIEDSAPLSPDQDSSAPGILETPLLDTESTTDL